MIKRYFKIFYFFLVIIFVFCTLYEFYKYMFFNSNIFGLFYLILNCFICINMIIIFLNFMLADYKIRVSKNVTISIFGLFSSFILPLIINCFLAYNDESLSYMTIVYASVKIIKPIIYLILIIFSVFECKLNVISTSRKNL